MMVSLASESGFEEERKLLASVFEKEERPDGAYYVYNYDQRYYKVLSACAKLRLRTRNLPEGNPSYIEVSHADWTSVMSEGEETPVASVAVSASAALWAPETQTNTDSNVHPLRLDISLPSDADEEHNIEQAVEELAQASNNGNSIHEEGTFMNHDHATAYNANTAANEDTATPDSWNKNVETVDLYERQKESFRTRTEALKSREEAIASREDAVRSREDAVRSREDAAKDREKTVAALEKELAVTETTFSEKEKEITARYEKLEHQRVDLEDQANRLSEQKRKISGLAEHLRKVAEEL